MTWTLNKHALRPRDCRVVILNHNAVEAAVFTFLLIFLLLCPVLVCDWILTVSRFAPNATHLKFNHPKASEFSWAMAPRRNILGQSSLAGWSRNLHMGELLPPPRFGSQGDGPKRSWPRATGGIHCIRTSGAHRRGGRSRCLCA
jgi:hypothetical protein